MISSIPDMVEYQHTMRVSQGGSTALNAHEKVKQYPFRYPSNFDSIGVEMVGAARNPVTGRAPYWNPKAVYDSATSQQNQSLTWLVRQLRRELNVGGGNVFRHPIVSIKNSTEAQSADWNVP
jgi:hypothetical protein